MDSATNNMFTYKNTINLNGLSSFMKDIIVNNFNTSLFIIIEVGAIRGLDTHIF